MKALIADLKRSIGSHAGVEADAAASKLDDLEFAALEDPPDVSTMVAVRNWFRRHLPTAAEKVTDALLGSVITASAAAASQETVELLRRLLTT